jgi:hypothetical protein
MAKQPYVGVAVVGITEHPMQEWDGNLLIQTRCFSRPNLCKARPIDLRRRHRSVRHDAGPNRPMW